jgi:hypothetical protein
MIMNQNVTHCCDGQVRETYPKLLFGGVSHLQHLSLLLDLVCRVLEIPHDVSFGRNCEKNE